MYVTSNGNHIYGPEYGASGDYFDEYCDDTTMPPPYTVNHDLDIVRRECEPLRISGAVQSSWPPGYTYVLSGWNPTAHSLYQYVPQLGSVDFNYWHTKAVANLNPNKPDVDIPLFIFEMKDFPEMLKNLGDVLSSRKKLPVVPETALAYQFGWAPLISDLKTLLNLQKSIERRKALLQSLAGGAHFSRRLTPKNNEIAREVIKGGGNYFDVGFSDFAFTADVETVAHQKVWYTANGKLTTPLPPADQLYDTSKWLTLGINVSTSTYWNSVPWSWLIDYFSNVGDFLNASRGTIGFTMSDICVMSRLEIVSKLTNVGGKGGISATGGTRKGTYKQRRAYSLAFPWVTTKPFLSNGQVFNLGNLITAKALKSKGFRGTS